MPQSTPPPPYDGSGTLLETDEEVRGNPQRTSTPAPVSTAATEASTPAAPRAMLAYQPLLRPPTALLTVYDDGKADGEVLRLRGDRFVIGRGAGDLMLPHDGLIADRHLEITRQPRADTYVWVITDLPKTSGLFVRCSRIALGPGSEFLVGQGRYRLEAGAAPGEYDTVSAEAFDGLVEIVATGRGRRVVLVTDEYWIGSDPACAIQRDNDPFVEARHVKLTRDRKGAWRAQNNKSLNGLWLRVPQIAVESACVFQIGEQRLRLTTGG